MIIVVNLFLAENLVTDAHRVLETVSDAVKKSPPYIATYAGFLRTTRGPKDALAYLEQNDIQRAILQLRYVHGTFAGTDEAKIARDKLASLGAPV